MEVVISWYCLKVTRAPTWCALWDWERKRIILSTRLFMLTELLDLITSKATTFQGLTWSPPQTKAAPFPDLASCLPGQNIHLATQHTPEAPQFIPMEQSTVNDLDHLEGHLHVVCIFNLVLFISYVPALWFLNYWCWDFWKGSMESVDPGMLDVSAYVCLRLHTESNEVSTSSKYCRNRKPNDSKSTAEPCSWWQHSWQTPMWHHTLREQG